MFLTRPVPVYIPYIVFDELIAHNPCVVNKKMMFFKGFKAVFSKIPLISKEITGFFKRDYF